MNLSDRKKRILKSIIDAYIAFGEPVGSKYLATHSDFSVSSATIRNEMNELETMGFLEQPHASAGRVPSAMGYRVYVDDLMERYRLGLEEIRLLNELLNFKINEVESILKDAGKVLSDMTDYTSFSVIKHPGWSAKRFECVRISPFNLLLVMLCEDGSVKTETLILQVEYDDETIKKLLEALNRYFTGTAAENISLPSILKAEEYMESSKELISAALRAVYDMTKRESKANVTIAGLPNLLNYPEFTDVEKAKGVLGMLDNDTDVVRTILSAQPGQTYILISGENGGMCPPDSSFIFRPLTSGGENIGAVGIIGPRRMNYRRVIASLEYFADGVTKTLNSTKINDDEKPKTG